MSFARPWVVLRPRQMRILSLGFFISLQAVNTQNTGLQGPLAGPHAWDFPNPWQKSWHACPLFQHLSRKFITSPPSPQFNVVYRDKVVIARFQHCRGEWVPYSSDAISCFQNSLLTHGPIIWSRRAKDFCQGLKVRLLARMLVLPRDFPFLAFWGMVIKNIWRLKRCKVEQHNTNSADKIFRVKEITAVYMYKLFQSSGILSFEW